VIELRLHRELYRGTAIDEAVKLYGPHATFELAEGPSYWTVRLTAASPERERRVAGELANYALGLTVRARQRA
jgi:hypothetical protein